MNVRGFEKRLSPLAPAASLDAITRHLRRMGLLPIGGRGASAPDITAEGAALILLALAGVANPNSAEQTARFINALRRSADGGFDEGGVVAEVARALTNPDTIFPRLREIRVCRASGDAQFVYHDGEVEAFRHVADMDDATIDPGSFRVEGVLPQKLLMIARDAISRPPLPEGWYELTPEQIKRERADRNEGSPVAGQS